MLIKEDGSALPDANTYVNIDEFKHYARLRHVDVSMDDESLSTILISAAEVLDSIKDCFQGEKATPEQRLQWPRVNVWVDHCMLANRAIPKEVASCQMLLATEGLKGVFVFELSEVGHPAFYGDDRRSKSKLYHQVNALLTPLYRRGSAHVARRSYTGLSGADTYHAGS